MSPCLEPSLFFTTQEQYMPRSVFKNMLQPHYPKTLFFTASKRMCRLLTLPLLCSLLLQKAMVIIGEVPTSLVYSSLQQLIGGGEREVAFLGEYEDVERGNLRTRPGCVRVRR